MNGQRHIDLLLNEIESVCQSCDRRCLELIDECLDLISEKLPAVGVAGHRTLKAYLGGSRQDVSLEEARTLCWSYLDEFGPSKYDFADPAVCAVRAVICGLWPVESLSRHDLVDDLGAFFDFVNVVEPHYEAEEQLLRRYFRAELLRTTTGLDDVAVTGE